LGSLEEFATVRNFFQMAEFDDRTVCQVLQIGGMTDFGRVRWEEIQLDSQSAFFRWCLNIFARGLQAGESESRTLCGEKVFAALKAVGLLRPAKKNPDAVLCPVWVYPVDGFVMASDRREDPEGEPFNPPADVVFPAIYPGTLRFLQLIPDARGGDALDHCGGSGIGALRLARTARTAVTADLTERSAFFAEFNSRLNGVAIESLCGDLYSPVAGRRFDLICAHPPFVPSTGETMVYRDGGETGETVTRRIIEGLPAHLRAGGTAVVLCVACDTERQTFEQRAREWLGRAGDEFDLIFGLEKVLSVAEVVESMRKRGQQIGDEAARQLQDRLRAAGTRQFVYGALYFRHCAERVVDAPVRVHLTSEGGAVDFERLLAWRHFRRQSGFTEWLASSSPRPAPRLLLTARHVVQDGELVPAEFVFSIEAGLSAALKPDAWVVPLAARLNGKRSVQEVFAEAHGADELPDGFTLEAFLGLVQRMIEMGFLTCDRIWK
jgi:SAM-dependent methyltransferase